MSIVKILLADDDCDYRTFLTKRLFNSYDIDFASNADEEVEKAKENKYSLIITDNKMHDGHKNSGIYAIEQIRMFDKEVPIIFHTGDNDLSILIDAITKGASNAIFKNESCTNLKSVLGKYLK